MSPLQGQDWSIETESYLTASTIGRVGCLRQVQPISSSADPSEASGPSAHMTDSQDIYSAISNDCWAPVTAGTVSTQIALGTRSIGEMNKHKLLLSWYVQSKLSLLRAGEMTQQVKGPWHHAWWPEIKPGRGLTFTSCPMTSTCITHTHTLK